MREGKGGSEMKKKEIGGEKAKKMGSYGKGAS
jgi:hypothetical protein